jgi:tRNA pseudouridine13 synthase
VVEEIPLNEPEERGAFHLLKLTKRNVSTLEALRVISRHLKIPLKKIGFAGLKDKFAITSQYITVPDEFSVPQRFCLVQTGSGWRKCKEIPCGATYIFLERVGKSKEPLTLGRLRANRFTIVVRNFEKSQREKFYRNYEVVKRYGFPNYFGEQRFGSVKSRDNFVLKFLLKGNFEEALRSYFFGKSNLELWGNWRKFYRSISGGLEEYERDLIKGLMRGLPAEKAFRILPKNVRLMFNFAYQSYLWNEVLRGYIEEKYPFVRIPFINNWKLSYYLEVSDLERFRELLIPYTAKEHEVEDKILKKVMERVFLREGVREEWFDAEVGGMKVMTDGLRRAVVFPEDFKILGKTKREITLTFSLPPGSYATVLLRFLLKG